MATSCPKCGSILEILDDDRVQCPQCNVRYRIRRPQNQTPAPSPAVRATVSPDIVPTIPFTSNDPPLKPLIATVAAVGRVCVNHPGVPAINRCRECRKSICSTCDFTFPEGVHLCPTCATSASKKLSPKRKTLLGWAYGVTIWSTVGIVAMFAGVFAQTFNSLSEAAFMEIVIEILVFRPAMVACALGLASLDKRLGNPPVVIVVVIWSGIVLAIWLVLIVIGLGAG